MNFLQWHDGFAPGHARGSEGELLVGGIGARTLAEIYGTPLVVIDFDAFDAAIAEFTEACAPYDIEIAYAGKALLLTGIARHLIPTPLALDVCSLGEIVTAEHAGFPATRITLHGCGKTDEELEAALAGRVGRIVVDSIEEIERLAGRMSRINSLRVIVRVNTGIEANVHEFVRTGGDNTKFGIPMRDVEAAIVALRNAPALHFSGLHSHIGSWMYDNAAFTESVEILADIAVRFAKSNMPSEVLIAGGGFGVQYDPAGEATPTIATTIGKIVSIVDEIYGKTGITKPRLGIEPGRALIARAGTSLYRVMARKRQSERIFVIVDGSLADNPRPALYNAYHHIAAASLHTPALSFTGDEPTYFEATICGRSCENDVLGEANLPSVLQVGDLIAMCTTGAYTYSMSSNYNRFTKPAVIALEGGEHRLFARRQTLDEVLHQDA